MTLYIFGFPQSFGCDRACNDLTRFPVDAFFFIFVLCVGDDDDESPVMKIARAFLKETIRSARTLEFSLPIRRMPSLRTCAGPSFLGCLRRHILVVVNRVHFLDIKR
jgi:hypothetical protein